MSDYLHEKVIRLPFPEEILKKCNTEYPWDCENYLEDLLGELWDSKSKSSFRLEQTDDTCYLDWRYYYTYGKEAGDWGYVTLLTKKELEVIKPYFDKLRVVYRNEDLRRVDYCYYNCSEPKDYYRLSEDDSKYLISINSF